MNFIKLLLIFGGVFFSCQLQAQHFSEKQSVYLHLLEVNKEWQYFQAASPIVSRSFNSEEERIQFHLEQAIDYLSNHKTEGLNAHQLEKRKTLLDKLRGYAEEKVFPQNIYHKERRPYFIDHLGTHCAVGYMMKISGHGDLAERISLEHNYDYLADIKTEGVEEWANEHGFGLDELAWIQPGYPANIRPFELIGGVGTGRINKMETYGNKIVLAGVFSELDSMPCLNIGYYENEHYTCLDGGIEGSILDMKVDAYNRRVLVSGALFENGIRYPLAIFDLDTWTWSYEEIPGRSGAIGIVTFVSSDVQSLAQELVIEHSAVQGNELWSWTGTQWVKKITTTGAILAIEKIANKTYYGGHFDSLLVHRLDSLDRMYYSQNIIYQLETGHFIDEMVPLGALGAVTDSVLTIAGTEDGSAVYFAGVSNKESDPCISLYDGTTVKTVVEWSAVNMDYYYYGINACVNSIKVNKNGILIIGGDFSYLSGSFFPVLGRNAIWYDPHKGKIYPYKTTYPTIKAVTIMDSDIYIGGVFPYAHPDAFFAKFDNLTSIQNIPTGPSFKVFPNPTRDQITIEIGERYQDVSVEVSNALGQLIKVKNYYSVNSIQFDLDGVPGLYFVKVRTEEMEQALQVIKE